MSRQEKENAVNSVLINLRKHAVYIDGNCIPNTISIDRATPVIAKDLVKTRITPSSNQPAQTIVTQKIDSECNVPPKYVVEKVVDHRHASKDLAYREHWYRYTPGENT